MEDKINLVFVHGWSVTSMNTYGELPLRLREEGLRNGLNIEVKEIFLGRYISFHDEVRLQDISGAFQTAVNEQLAGILADGSKFMCITHSTGGPVIRNWWMDYYLTNPSKCPMSHLIMLAPANFGSALAQLGKARIGRIKSWMEGVEPGQGVLDWLELGSSGSWQLNNSWIRRKPDVIGPEGIFPFVLIGQSIDRSFYDNLNTYTGEAGSDGVVRSAAANLNSRYFLLDQPDDFKVVDGQTVTGELKVKSYTEAPATAFRIVRKKSHSGDEMGIMKSVSRDNNDAGSADTIKAIFQCIKVKTQEDYNQVCIAFNAENEIIQQEEKLETEKRILIGERYFIHDRYSMVIFRVKDTEGRPVTDFDLLLTAGEYDDPNHFPEGFCIDRQRNRLNPETITLYFNYDVINGCDPVVDKDHDNEVVRKAVTGTTMLGLQVIPRPSSGFVKYVPCGITASEKVFAQALVPNSTTLIEICLQRVVDKEVFRVELLVDDTLLNVSFKDTGPGGEIVTN